MGLGLGKAIPRWLYETSDPLNDPLFVKGFETGREVQKIFDEQPEPKETPGKFEDAISIVYEAIRSSLKAVSGIDEHDELLEAREESLCYYAQRAAEKIFDL